MTTTGTCPGCANRVSEMERLTGVCAKDGLTRVGPKQSPVEEAWTEARVAARRMLLLAKYHPVTG